MTIAQITSVIDSAFGKCQRPEIFIRGTCCCEECMEHEAAMQQFDVHDLPLGKLNNPGWDPICFASNTAFNYLMPGLVHLLLEHTDSYLSQFIFHISQPERYDAFTTEQSRALLLLMEYLVEHATKELEDNLVSCEVLLAREIFAQPPDNNHI